MARVCSGIWKSFAYTRDKKVKIFQPLSYILFYHSFFSVLTPSNFHFMKKCPLLICDFYETTLFTPCHITTERKDRLDQSPERLFFPDHGTFNEPPPHQVIYVQPLEEPPDMTGGWLTPPFKTEMVTSVASKPQRPSFASKMNWPTVERIAAWAGLYRSGIH